MHYKPWSTAAPTADFAHPAGPVFRKHCMTPTRELLHEACVRMVRADYCGDGRSHTVDGMAIDVWD